MSNSLTNAVTGIGRFIYKWSLRLTKITKHRLLTKRKNILLFGEHNNPLYTSIYRKLQPTWEITRIYTIAPENSNTQTQSQNTQSPLVQKANEPDNKTLQVQVAKVQPKETFYKEYLLNNNYVQLQKQLESKQFDCVMVLPNIFPQKQRFSFEDQGLVLEYPQIHQNQLLRNIFAYRLSSKYLTTTGSFILSSSQRDILKAEPQSYTKNIKSFKEPWWPSVELVDAQSLYLGVVVGQRDYTDLNSWGVVALSREWIEQDVQLVTRNYVWWAEGEKLPMPGSFALFKRKGQKEKHAFVQYL